jgi:DNA-directed RNA polymerase subunit RPC12/RpoP
MGEYAEMMLDGTCCGCCGEYLGDGDGYTVYCASCAPDFEEKSPKKEKADCPECGKRVKAAGVADHMRVVHGITPND